MVEPPAPLWHRENGFAFDGAICIKLIDTVVNQASNYYEAQDNQGHYRICCLNKPIWLFANFVFAFSKHGTLLIMFLALY